MEGEDCPPRNGSTEEVEDHFQGRVIMEVFYGSTAPLTLVA